MRGDKFIFLREDDSIGAEISIGRPVLVLNNQELIDKLPTVTVAYMTTTPKNCIDTVKVFTGRKWSYILLNQIRTIDKSRLNEFMWALPVKDMSRVDTALSYTFSIGKFIDENEVLKEDVVDNTSELASLKMELALHKALYEKTLEKLIELRLEKDGVTEKPMVVPVEEPLDLSGLTEKFKVHDARPAKKEISDDEVKQILSSVSTKKKSRIQSRKAQVKRGAKPININTASREEFKSVGISDQTARQIVNYREKHGYFISVEDLLMVPRFGKGCMSTFGSLLEV